MPLSDTAIRAAKPRDKAYKMADGDGLTLLVKPNGSKLWRMRYRHGGIEKMLSFGMYPDVPVKLARKRRDEARRKLAQNEDPGAERKAERDARGNTLRVLALEWFELQSNPPENSGRAALTPVTAKKTKWMLEAFLFPKLGDIWINDITAARLYGVLRKIESRGIRETAHVRWRVEFFDSLWPQAAPTETLLSTCVVRWPRLSRRTGRQSSSRGRSVDFCGQFRTMTDNPRRGLLSNSLHTYSSDQASCAAHGGARLTGTHASGGAGADEDARATHRAVGAAVHCPSRSTAAAHGIHWFSLSVATEY
jgi:Arm DNA-binding domain/Phage integrase central domain